MEESEKKYQANKQEVSQRVKELNEERRREAQKLAALQASAQYDQKPKPSPTPGMHDKNKEHYGEKTGKLSAEVTDQLDAPERTSQKTSDIKGEMNHQGDKLIQSGVTNGEDDKRTQPEKEEFNSNLDKAAESAKDKETEKNASEEKGKESSEPWQLTKEELAQIDKDLAKQGNMLRNNGVTSTEKDGTPATEEVKNDFYAAIARNSESAKTAEFTKTAESTKVAESNKTTESDKKPELNVIQERREELKKSAHPVDKEKNKSQKWSI